MRTILNLFGLLAGSALLAACGLRIPDPAPYVARCEAFARPAPAETVGGLFFMTSRLPDCRGERLLFPGIRYAELHYGISDPAPDPSVSWDRPDSILLTQADWEAALGRDLRAGGNRGRVLVYVHGYFNDFDDALQRAAILRTQYGREVPTVVVSWPSRNRPQSYSYDEDTIEWAQDHLDGLLRRLAETSDDITLVGHSMGARAVMRAVERLDPRARAAHDLFRHGRAPSGHDGERGSRVSPVDALDAQVAPLPPRACGHPARLRGVLHVRSRAPLPRFQLRARAQHRVRQATVRRQARQLRPGPAQAIDLSGD